MLIHASNADDDFSDNEKEFLKSKFDPALFTEVSDIYEQKSDYEIDLFFIKHNKKFLNSKSRKDTFFMILDELYAIDGKFCRFEQFFDQYFKKLHINT